MISAAAKELLNRLNRKARLVGLGTELDRTEKVVTGIYDFDVDAGEIGTIDLSESIPAGAIITQMKSDELTPLTSGGSATVEIKAGSTSLSALIAFDSGFTGIDNHAFAGSVDGIKVSAVSALGIDIATAAITAGKVRFYIYYVEAKDN